MIVRCASCTKRYSLDENILGSQGQRVRCTACGYVWHQSPPPQRNPVVVFSPPEATPYLPTLWSPPPVKKKLSPLVWVGSSILMAISCLALALIFAKDPLIRCFPTLRDIYTLFHVPSATPEIHSFSWGDSGHQITCRGLIHNASAEVTYIPPLILSVIRMIQGKPKVVYQIQHTFPADPLLPGQTRTFEVILPSFPEDFSSITPSFKGPEK